MIYTVRFAHLTKPPEYVTGDIIKRGQISGIDAEKSRDRWKTSAIILGCVGIILAGGLAISIAL